MNWLTKLWARLAGKDDEAKEAERRFQEATAGPPPVDAALADVIAAANVAAAAARRTVRMTPPPVPRLVAMASNPTIEEA